MSRGTAAERLEKELPPGSCLQILAAIDELRRRLASGRAVKPEISITIELDRKTAEVVEVVVPRSYGR